MPATDCVFRWTKVYSVNVHILDRQHQILFRTVNELEQALRVGAGQDSVEEALSKLVNYAAEHFAAEEALMERHGFPGLASHRLQHEMFRDKINSFLTDYRAGKSSVPVSLLLFLQNWLKQHVLKTDKLYSAFLNARGVQ